MEKQENGRISIERDQFFSNTCGILYEPNQPIQNIHCKRVDIHVWKNVHVYRKYMYVFLNLNYLFMGIIWELRNVKSKYTDVQINLITQSEQSNGTVEGIKIVLPHTSLP